MLGFLRSLVAFASGLMVGLALGYAAALALAPYEGADTRVRLRSEASTIRTRPRKVAGSVQTRFQNAVEEGRLAAAEAREELQTSAGLHGRDGRSDGSASPV